MGEKEERIQGALGLVEYEVTFFDSYGKLAYSGKSKSSNEEQAIADVKQAALDSGVAKKLLKFSKATRKHT